MCLEGCSCVLGGVGLCAGRGGAVCWEGWGCVLGGVGLCAGIGRTVY